jgi:hypothetical protein
MGSTTKKLSARDRAREARRRADAARAQRDEAVEAAAAAYFAGDDERGKLLERIEALTADVVRVEQRMGAQLAALGTLGESAAWQRELLGLDEAERKRLRTLADDAATVGGREPRRDQMRNAGEPATANALESAAAFAHAAGAEDEVEAIGTLGGADERGAA